MAQNDKKLSVSLLISGGIPYMIVCFFGTHVQNDISSNFFHFLKILIFLVFSGKKRANNDL